MRIERTRIAMWCCVHPAKVVRWDKPFLITHGGADTIVAVQQSCALAEQGRGLFRTHQIDIQGGVCRRLAWA